MKEQLMYIADDGKVFKSKEDCQVYENALYENINIMNALRYDSRIFDFNAIKQDPIKVKEAFSKLMDQCSRLICTYSTVFQLCKWDDRNNSRVHNILCDYSQDYPFLLKAFNRFECIDNNYIEYCQPAYVRHPEYFIGEIF